MIDRFVSDQIKDPNSDKNLDGNSYLDYFNKYGNMAIMNGTLLEWYTDNLLKKNPVYEIKEAERVVCYT